MKPQGESLFGRIPQAKRESRERRSPKMVRPAAPAPPPGWGAIPPLSTLEESFIRRSHSERDGGGFEVRCPSPRKREGRRRKRVT